MNNNFANFDETSERQPNKILIIDDLADNLHLLESTLKERGYEVRCAKTAFMALMAVESYKPDLILLDIKLPDLDGYEVCKQLKANPKTREITVIFLTVLNDTFDKIRAFEVGAADYISKPFQIPEVLARINHQLNLISAKIKYRNLNAFLEKKVQQRTAELQQEIIERIKAQMQAKQDREKLESILNSLQEVVISIDVNSWNLIYLNPAAEKIYDRAAIDLLDRNKVWLEVIYPEDRQRVEQCFSQLKSGNNITNMEVEYRILRPNGEIRWLNDRRYLVYDDNGEVLRIDAIINDISDRKQAERRWLDRSVYDGLTGLPNRSLFVDLVEISLKQIQDSTDHCFAILWIDLDNYNSIAVNFGNAIADMLLIAFAELLKNCLRANDILARWSENRFGAILDRADRVSKITQIINSMQTELELPLNIAEDRNILANVSIGVVFSSKNYRSASELFRDADIAISRAKQEDNNASCSIFEPQMSAENSSQFSIETELQLALDRQEFLLYYQPIISLSDRKLVAFEALLRWQHPERGLISPTNFIAIVEQKDLILRIAEWVIDRACLQLKDWQMKFEGLDNVKIAVNLTGREITEANFIPTVDRILETTDLDPNCLQFEIPENSLLEESEAHLTVLNRIKHKKIGLSIDNFGADLSCLKNLHRLPIDNLKICSSFIENMHLSQEKCDLVRTSIALAHSLGKNAIALSVEAAEQLAQLESLGCQQAQGHFFCKPLNATAVESIVSVNSQMPFQ